MPAGPRLTEPEEDLPPPESTYPPDAWQLLAPQLTPARRARMAAVAAARTRRVRLVVQDIHHPHNVSACLRSADAFGVQDVDIVTLHESFRASTVARGVADWLTLRRFRAVDAAVTALRKDGYRLFAGVPVPGALPLDQLPAGGKIAVVFGNEKDGIDPAWRAHIDQPFTIPMVGMVESLNISVSAAITLRHLTEASRAAAPDGYLLSDAERTQLLSAWACRQVSSWSEQLARLRGAPAT
jgi:tRNA (guanosine-2'-O-)-methyltransferase